MLPAFELALHPLPFTKIERSAMPGCPVDTRQLSLRRNSNTLFILVYRWKDAASHLYIHRAPSSLVAELSGH